MAARQPLAGGAKTRPMLLGLLLAGGAAQAQLLPPPTPPDPALPRQRAGSAPTPPVRFISPDPTAPVGPPTPGARPTGQSRVPGASRQPVPDTVARRAPVLTDTSVIVGTRRGANDSLRVAARPRGAVETTVKYAADDSIQFDVESKVARLYSKANVDYGPMNLKAALITVNYGENVMLAEGRRDSVKNRLEGRPVFQDKDGLYTAGKIAYNFKTRKGKIAEAVTQQGEGYVSAETIKKMADNELYGLNGRYTTCNLEHPHFYIQASKMKVIPGDKVVTGPFNLVIADVPTPLGFLFGFFPSPSKNRGSGLLIPTFGQATDRGYFLTNGGYYFAPNDYIGVRLTGDVYAGNAQSFGGWGGTADISYLKRYTYRGGFTFRYTNRPSTQLVPVNGVSTTPEYVRPPADQTFWISWNHTPVPRPGGGSFTAQVGAGSSSYNRVNTLNPRGFLTPSFSSSIGYSKTIRNSPVNYNVRLSQSQNTQTGVMDFTLPDVSVGVARQYPYQWLGLAPQGRFYEQFAISYNLTAQNRVSNAVAARRLDGTVPLLGGSPAATTIPISFSSLNTILRNSQNGVQHQFGIALGSYKVARHFTVSPSVNYGEVWYSRRLDYRYNETARAVRVDTVTSFNRLSTASAGVSVNTAFYGTAVLKGKTIEAIRHKVTPSLSYNFTPDSRDLNRRTLGQDPVAFPGFLDPNGQQLAPRTFSPYNGFLYGAPVGRQAQAIGFALQNAVEMKVVNKRDTTGTARFRKVSLIDGLDFSASYNFQADSLKLSPIGATFRTQIAKKLNLNASASFSTYQRDSTGREIDRYLAAQSRVRLARLTAATIGATYTFNPASGKKKSAVPRAVAPANDPTLGTPGPPSFYADYVDFEIPWELSLSFNSSYTTTPVPRTLRTPYTPLFSVAAMQMTGSVKLTDNLRLTYSAGYDFVHKNVTYPNIAFFRDLHCWQISGMWIPIGQTRGYNFTIAAKSSLLQDLRLNRNRLQQFQ